MRLILVLTSNGSQTENRFFINDFSLPVKRRIQYIDAIKGISGIWVAFFHYVLAFFPVGYVGWGSGVEDSDRAARYFSEFPASAFTNSSFPLYTFFALISFTLATAHFGGGNGEPVRRQAVKRYFRLMPPVFACTMICYALVAGGLMFNARLGELAPSEWSSAFYGNEASFWQAMVSGLFAAFVYGDGYYCSILWCMNAIFIGSYLSYGILLLFGGVRGRWLFYAAIFALCAAAWGDCAAFVAGIAAADIAVSFPRLKNIRGLGVALIFSGLAAGVFFPPVWLPRGVQAGALYSAANFAFLLGFALSVSAQRAVGFKWLCGAGKWSFALILVHFPVMMSFSAWAFVALTGGDGISLRRLRRRGRRLFPFSRSQSGSSTNLWSFRPKSSPNGHGKNCAERRASALYAVLLGAEDGFGNMPLRNRRRNSRAAEPYALNN